MSNYSTIFDNCSYAVDLSKNRALLSKEVQAFSELQGTLRPFRSDHCGALVGQLTDLLNIPRCSMYGIFANIYPKNGPNVSKYSIHGASGINKCCLYANFAISFFYQRANFIHLTPFSIAIAMFTRGYNEHQFHPPDVGLGDRSRSKELGQIQGDPGTSCRVSGIFQGDQPPKNPKNPRIQKIRKSKPLVGGWATPNKEPSVGMMKFPWKNKKMLQITKNRTSHASQQHDKNRSLHGQQLVLQDLAFTFLQLSKSIRGLQQDVGPWTFQRGFPWKTMDFAMENHGSFHEFHVFSHEICFSLYIFHQTNSSNDVKRSDIRIY